MTIAAPFFSTPNFASPLFTPRPTDARATYCYRLCRMLRALCWSRSLTTMTRVAPRNPLIAIIGATGTGKSQVKLHM